MSLQMRRSLEPDEFKDVAERREEFERMRSSKSDEFKDADRIKRRRVQKEVRR